MKSVGSAPRAPTSGILPASSTAAVFGKYDAAPTTAATFLLTASRAQATSVFGSKFESQKVILTW